MTEYLNTGEKELINRTINIDENFIQIKTQTENGVDIQVLKIVESKLNRETKPPTIIYDCTSPDGVYPTTYLFLKKKL
ncbi:hypothetical protein [Autumnicola psychrophila]|uniref:Transposase n=1 Tax=Autumnicola psychrophila TaxID=3075592 RepID=A0ABU3DPD3_9FLAO|nr:hypothetical protein [Zunongwangia sp. F225]MDT0685580.1 hypothetical protein [Zunongwangia sp. F225]